DAARWRARRRAIAAGSGQGTLDVAGLYRRRLADPGSTVTVRAACVEGLVATGTAREDLERVAAALADPAPRVRAAALAAVAGWSDRVTARQAARAMLLDPSGRVTSTAARTLTRLGVPVADADEAWASHQPWSRRAAWRVSRDA